MKCIKTILATGAFFTTISLAQDADASNTANTDPNMSSSANGKTPLSTSADDAGLPGYTTASTGTTSISQNGGLSTHEPVLVGTDNSPASTSHTAHSSTGTAHVEAGGTAHEPLPTTLGSSVSTGQTAHPTTVHAHPETGATAHGPPLPVGPHPFGDGMKVMIDGTLHAPVTMCGEFPDGSHTNAPGLASPYGHHSSDAVIHPTGNGVSSCFGEKSSTAGGHTAMTTLRTTTVSTGHQRRPTMIESNGGKPGGGKIIQVQFSSTTAENRSFAIPLTNVSTPILPDSDGIWAKKMAVLPSSPPRHSEEAAEGIEDGKARGEGDVECAASSDADGKVDVGVAVREGETGGLMISAGGQGVGDGSDEQGVKVRSVRCWQAGMKD